MIERSRCGSASCRRSSARGRRARRRRGPASRGTGRRRTGRRCARRPRPAGRGGGSGGRRGGPRRASPSSRPCEWPTAHPATAAANASPSAISTIPASMTTAGVCRFAMNADHTPPVGRAKAAAQTVRSADARRSRARACHRPDRSRARATGGAAQPGTRSQKTKPSRSTTSPRVQAIGSREERPGVHEGVELAVLAARVDSGGQVGEEPRVVRAPGERRVEHARIDADDDRREAAVDELAGQLGRCRAPRAERRRGAGRRQALLAVGADVLEEEVAEGDRVDARERGAGERLPHPLLVDLVAAGRGDRDLDERDAEGLGLAGEELAPDAVDADPVVPLGHGREQHARRAALAAKRPQRECGVLPAAPREGEGGRRARLHRGQVLQYHIGRGLPGPGRNRAPARAGAPTARASRRSAACSRPDREA